MSECQSVVTSYVKVLVYI